MHFSKTTTYIFIFIYIYLQCIYRVHTISLFFLTPWFPRLAPAPNCPALGEVGAPWVEALLVDPPVAGEWGARWRIYIYIHTYIYTYIYIYAYIYINTHIRRAALVGNFIEYKYIV